MAATLAPDDELVFFSFPIEKKEETEAINPVDGTPDILIWGKATDGTVDRDLQIVDPDWSGKALREWVDTGGNVRFSHDAHQPVGKGLQVEVTPDGHYVKSLIADPKAKHFIRQGILGAYSVGISHPDIRYGGFPHLDPEGKAIKGIITGRNDGLSEIAELSIVDRPSNYGTKFQLVRKGADGVAEFTGKVIAAGDLLTKAADDTVNVDVPKSAQITFSPGDLAKLLKHRSAAEDRETDIFKAMTAAEEDVFKRNIDTATRRRLASEGKALPNLSYPIENAEDLGNAATLARSGHGDVGAARKLIARRAKELGVANPLDEDDAKKADDVDAAKAMPAGAAVADVAKDAAVQMHHNDDQDDDTESEADDMDKSAAPMAKKPKVPCPKCKGMVKPKAKFCGKCGAPMMAKKSATPGDGVVGEHTEPAPPHREPDGPAIEALERDADMPTVPDSSVKADEDAAVMAVAARHKSVGVDSEQGMLHDLTCAAYDPADVAKSYPGMDFTAINVQGWLDKTLTLAASAPLDQAREAGKLVETAVTLKAIAPGLADELRHEAFKAFRDANPGPGHAPTPTELSADRFKRPLITAGHSAPSPGQGAPHTSPIHPEHIAASDYQRDLITDGRAADSPDNDPGHPMPLAAPEVPGVPSRVFYTQVQRQNAQQAMRSMHDHIAATFPDLCPMHGPGRMGEPPSHARPVPVGVGGPVPHGATKTAEASPVVDEFEQAEATARAARKAARRQQRELLDAIIKGDVTVEDARTQLGAEPVLAPATKAVGSVTSDEVIADVIKSAVADAQAPLMERLDAQQRLLDAMADQPDPRVAAYRGVALNKTSAAPAGLLDSPEQRPAGASDAAYKAMYEQWENTTDPELRENAWRFLTERAGLIKNARA